MNRRFATFSCSLATFSSLAALAAASALCTGCADDVAEPYQLTHPRVLAIRAEPAVIPAGTTARLDVLFTDGAAPPRLATTEELTFTLPPELDQPALAGLLAREPQGWVVRSPDEATLAAARAQLELPAGAPVPLPIDVAVDGASHSPNAEPLLAQKIVSFGTIVGNPEPPVLTLDDQQITDGVRIPHGAELALSAAMPAAATDSPLAEPAGEITYRWFASFGELRRYTQPLALLTAESDERGPGSLLVIARTAAGGVSWTLVAAEVTEHPPPQ
jgi:hypothetical protein